MKLAFFAFLLLLASLLRAEEFKVEFPALPKSTWQGDVRERAFLRAIRMVETGDNVWAVGRRGELGAYQFRRMTWRQHTRMPFNQAQSDHANDVAHLHYKWICQQIESAGVNANFYQIAIAWNAGVGAVLNGRVGSETRGYAERVVNLATHYLPPVTPILTNKFFTSL